VFQYILRAEDGSAYSTMDLRSLNDWVVKLLLMPVAGSEQLVIRGIGWLRSSEDGLRDIGDVPLKDVGGVAVRVRDVAILLF